MIYEKHLSVVGNWAKGKDIKSGTKCKLVGETKPMTSQFKDKNGNEKKQDVSKIQFQGQSEPLNISINRASLNALIDAFGTDSIKWQGHTLTAKVVKTMVGGSFKYPIYLIPEGYEMIEDDNGYAVIVKVGSEVSSEPIGDLEVQVDELPF